MPAAEQAVLARALLWLPLTALAVRWHGLGSQAGIRATAPRAGRAVAPARIAALVDIAARHGLARGNCLSRSLTLRRLLLDAGVDAQLRIGVRNGVAGLEAHAWVEHDGRPLNDAPDVAGRYAPFPSLPGALPRLV